MTGASTAMSLAYVWRQGRLPSLASSPVLSASVAIALNDHSSVKVKVPDAPTVNRNPNWVRYMLLRGYAA